MNQAAENNRYYAKEPMTLNIHWLLFKVIEDDMLAQSPVPTF